MNQKSNIRTVKGFYFKNSIIIISLLILNLSGFGQDSENINPRKANIHAITRANSDSVILRWAPSTPGGWVIANKIGYVIERIQIEADKAFDASNYQKLNNAPIKPLSLESWETTSEKDNAFSAIAAQALYGKYFNPNPMNTGSLDALKNAADELTNRYSFSLFAADNDAFTANALGLRWVDKNVEPEKRYAYRIYIAEKTDEYSFDTAYVLVDIDPDRTDLKPTNLRFESGDREIKLFWDDHNTNLFSGYYIYKSDDHGKSYKKLNDMPFVNITNKNAVRDAVPSFIDTSVVNYKKYVYRVRGIDPFAILSAAAEIEAYSKDLSPPPAPKMKKAEQISDQQIKISWELDNAPADLQGFAVSRSNNSLYNYNLLTQETLSKNTFEFIDVLNNASQAYYTVAAVDTAGNMSFSVPVLGQLINDMPPSVPTGLNGNIDKNGKVSLQWDQGPESNLKGYRVLWSNDPTHEFIQLTGQVHADTVFNDSISLQTLTKNIYYRIAAVNNRYQHSELSEILELKRPDVIKPGEAVFSDVFVTDTNVSLKWYPSFSEDVIEQVLLKRIQGKKEWIPIDTLSAKVNFYVDSDVKTKIIYEYSMISTDNSGLSSDYAFPVQARPYDSGKRKAVENFSAEYDKENKTVKLSWNYMLPEKEKIWYVIYKAGSDGLFKEYKAIKDSDFSFVDKNIKQGESRYGIVVMTSSGGESEMITQLIYIDEMD